MPSCKVVFFLPPDVEGCHFLKKLFQEKYGMPVGIDEGLAFDYISHKVNVTSMDLKLYVVPDLEKYEKIRPLYFTNVHTFVVVFDVTKWSFVTWEKICQDLNLPQSHSKMVFLGYKKDEDNINAEMFDFISSRKGIYLEFSGHDDLALDIEYLFENLDEQNAETSEETGAQVGGRDQEDRGEELDGVGAGPGPMADEEGDIY